MTVMTSTMRMQLDAADFVRNAKQVADAVGADVKKIEALKTALADSGASNKLQASMLKLGAGTDHVEGMKRALADFRKEQGLVGKAWADLTKEEKAALATFESATAATMRAIVKGEQDASTAMLRDVEHRNAALLSKETALRERMLAEDCKAEDKRIALAAAEAAERATISNRELAARTLVEAEVTRVFRSQVTARENASREELATIERIAGLEKQARVRAIHAETAAIVEARDAQRHAEEHAMQHAQARAGIGHVAAQTAAAYVSAHGVISGVERAAEAGSELQNTRLSMRRAGIDPEMRAQLEQQALDLSRRFGNVGQVAIMDLQKEARSVLKDQHEVFGTTEILAKAKSVLDAGGGHSEGLGKLVKGAESIGAANDPARLAKLIDSYVKAIQVMGETINPEQIYEFDKYLKTAGATVSDRFLMTTGLSLSQEMGGSTAANDIFHAQKDIMGGFQNKHVPIQEMVRMGLISRSDVEYTKTGEAKGIRAGHKGVHGAELAQTDLDEWVYKFLLPAMEKHGLKDEKAQLAYVQKVFTGGEGNVIAKLIQQREGFENHGVMYGKASGTAAADYNADSATAGLSAFNAALGNLMGNVTVEAMAPVGHVLYRLADWMNVAAQAAKDHPIAALSVGGVAAAGGLAASGTMAYYVATGFGLPAAAGQLAASATALDAAAAKMGAGGAAGAVEKAAEAIPGVGLASKLATAVPIVGAGLFVADAMVNRRDTSKALVDGGRPDALTVNDNNSMLPGFDVGGWTGPGGRLEPAGVVHREEFVVKQGPAARHRSLLEAMNRGDINLPSYATGGMVEGEGSALVRSGALHIALASDSTSAAILRQVFTGAMLEALHRIKAEGGLGDAGGSGGGTGGAGYGGVSDHHAAPSIRYGRQHSGRGGGADVGGRASAMSGDVAGRARDAMAQLEGLGWTHEAAAAAIGNAQQESGVRSDGPLGDTARFGFGDDAAHGMFQWRGQRFRNLKAFAEARGKQWQDFRTQVAFFDAESKKSYGADEWSKTHDIVHANRGMERFEGYGDKSFGTRLANARQLAAGKNDGGFYPAAAPSAEAGNSAPAGVSDGAGARAVSIAGKLDGASGSQAAAALSHPMHLGQWCADFVNGTLAKAGIKGSGSAMASSFKTWGTHVDFKDVKPGDVIYEDHGRGKGHAGIATGASKVDSQGRLYLGMTSGNHGGRVHRDYWERASEIADLRRSDEELAAAAEARRRTPLPPTGTAAPASTTGRHHAMSGGVDFDHSHLDAAIAKVDTLHAKLKGLKATASVDINHKHTHRDERTANASPKFRPFRSHTGSPAGRILV